MKGRDRKNLGAYAQLSPAATVSPKRKKEVVEDFLSGVSAYQVATKWGLPVRIVEHFIRLAMRRRR